MTIKYLDSKRISTSGTPANYWDFDGTADYVSTPDLLNVNTFTVSGWVSADSTGDTWFKSGDSTNGDFFIGMTGSKASVTSYYTGGADSLTGSTDVPSGWNHVVVVRDASTSTLKIYLNGTLDGSMSLTQTGANYYTNNEHFIGKRLGSGGGAWDGKISFVTVWHRVLSVSEITALYDSGSTSDIPTTNLVAHYNFAQTGSTLEDQANSNDGTNSGATTGGTRNITQDKPTNVETNSILVEKDTSKRYWFDGSAWTQENTIIVTVGTSTNALVMHGNPYYGKASRFLTGHAIIGKTVTSIDVDLIKTGSPTGTLVVGKYNTSGALVTTFGSISASTISTSKTTYTFNTSTDTVANNEYIGVRHDSGRDTSNYISTYGSSSNITAYAGLYTYNGSWLDDSSTDLYMVISYI